VIAVVHKGENLVPVVKSPRGAVPSSTFEALQFDDSTRMGSDDGMSTGAYYCGVMCA
jgi:hypothetical protein